MAETKKISGTVWTLLFCVWAAQAVSQIITFGYGLMMPGIMEELQVTPEVMGRIGGVASFTTVFLTIPISIIAVKYNPRFSVPITIICMAAGLFLFGISTNIPMMYGSRMVAAAFSQAIGTVLVAVKVRGVPTEKMTQINGVENFVGPGGQVIATLAMAPILTLLGSWREVYIAIAVIMAAAAIIYMVTYGNGKSLIYGTPTDTKTEKKSDEPSALLSAWKNKTVWLISLAWPGTTIVWIAMFYFWPSYAIADLGITLEQAGLVLSFIPIFSAIASLTAPMIANKIGYDKPLIWPWGLILPVMYYMMIRVSSIPLLCVFSAVAGYGAYCFVPMAFTALYKLGLSQKAVSMAVGTVLSFVALGTALAGTIVGALTTQLGLQTALAVSCLTPLWFGVLMFFIPELGRKKMEQLAAQAETEKGA